MKELETINIKNGLQPEQNDLNLILLLLQQYMKSPQIRTRSIYDPHEDVFAIVCCKGETITKPKPDYDITTEIKEINHLLENEIDITINEDLLCNPLRIQKYSEEEFIAIGERIYNDLSNKYLVENEDLYLCIDVELEEIASTGKTPLDAIEDAEKKLKKPYYLRKIGDIPFIG